MTRYVIADYITGEILRTVQCGPEQAPSQVKGEQLLIPHETAEPWSHRVDPLTWRVVAKPAEEPTIAEAKAKHWQYLKQAREEAEKAPFDWMGLTFDGNPTRISQYATEALMAIVANEPWKVEWTLADNSKTTLYATSMLEVHKTMQARVRAIHDKSQALRLALDQASTLAEIGNIRW